MKPRNQYGKSMTTFTFILRYIFLYLGCVNNGETVGAGKMVTGEWDAFVHALTSLVSLCVL